MTMPVSFSRYPARTFTTSPTETPTSTTDDRIEFLNATTSSSETGRGSSVIGKTLVITMLLLSIWMYLS